MSKKSAVLEMAEDLYASIMKTAGGLGQLTAEQRNALYSQVAEYSFDMALAFDAERVRRNEG